MRPVRRTEQIELVIPGGSTATKFNFPDIPQLRSDVTKDIVIRAMRTYNDQIQPLDFNGNTVVSLAQLQGAFLTLYVDGEESTFRVPLTDLLNSEGILVNPQIWNREIFSFDDIRVDWTKSYITLAAALGNANPIAFTFQVHYKRYPGGTLDALAIARGAAKGFDICYGTPMM